MLKLRINYPSREEEKEIVRRFGVERALDIQPVLSPKELDEVCALVGRILLDEKLLDYILDIVFATRDPKRFNLEGLSPLIEYGASPRATIYLAQAARAYAFLRGRAYVTPQDIKTVAPDVLRHRIILTYEAEAEDVDTDQVIRRIFDVVEVP